MIFKQITLEGFVEELDKIASWEDVKTWVKKHPWLTAAGAAGLGAGGVLGKRFLGRAAAPMGETSARLRRLAEEDGLGFAYSHGGYKDPTTVQKAVARLRLGGLKPIYTDPTGNILRSGSKAEAPKGVTLGLTPSKNLAGEIHGTPQSMAHGGSLEMRGKVQEISPEVGLSHLFERGASASDVMKKYNISRPPIDASMEEKKQFLRQLQTAMKKEYGGEFVMKPHGQVSSAGSFPTHKGDWGNIYEDYTKRLKPEMQNLELDVMNNPKKFKGPQRNIIPETFRDDPAFVGGAFESALNQPERTLSQKMMNIVKMRSGKPAEYRVHMIGGEVPEQLAYNRYAPVRETLSRVPGVGKAFRGGRLGSSQEAADWVRKNVPSSIAEKYREGTFGLDVIRVKNPDGSLGYKLVELNPSTSRTTSGFLSPKRNPLVSQDVYKWVRGKDAPLVTGAKATGAGAATGGGFVASKLLAKKPEKTPVNSTGTPSST